MFAHLTWQKNLSVNFDGKYVFFPIVAQNKHILINIILFSWIYKHFA